MKKITTELQHLGQAKFDSETGLAPVALPSMRTSTVRFKDMATHDATQLAKQAGARAATYGRVGLDTHAALEEILCTLEQGQRAFLAPSGMAAISMTLLALLNQDEHALVIDSAYGPVRNLQDKILCRLGIDMDFVAPNVNSLNAALRPQTKILYLESPGSLLLEMLDLPQLANWAHEHGLIVVADNTWGSGYIYKPLELGADVSVVAVTKYIGGHSDLMLGAAIAKDSEIINKLNLTHYALGSTVSADDAWLAIRGARTLPIRMQTCAANASAVYNWLAEQNWVHKVFTPAWPADPGYVLWQRDALGANGLFAIAIDLTNAQARLFVDNLSLFGIGYSWGGYESLITIVDQKALSEHSYWRAISQSIKSPAAVLRLHIGLEDPADLINDIQQAYALAIA